MSHSLFNPGGSVVRIKANSAEAIITPLASDINMAKNKSSVKANNKNEHVPAKRASKSNEPEITEVAIDLSKLFAKRLEEEEEKLKVSGASLAIIQSHSLSNGIITAIEQRNDKNKSVWIQGQKTAIPGVFAFPPAGDPKEIGDKNGFVRYETNNFIGVIKTPRIDANGKEIPGAFDVQHWKNGKLEIAVLSDKGTSILDMKWLESKARIIDREQGQDQQQDQGLRRKPLPEIPKKQAKSNTQQHLSLEEQLRAAREDLKKTGNINEKGDFTKNHQNLSAEEQLRIARENLKKTGNINEKGDFIKNRQNLSAEEQLRIARENLKKTGNINEKGDFVNNLQTSTTSNNQRGNRQPDDIASKTQQSRAEEVKTEAQLKAEGISSRWQEAIGNHADVDKARTNLAGTPKGKEEGVLQNGGKDALSQIKTENTPKNSLMHIDQTRTKSLQQEILAQSEKLRASEQEGKKGLEDIKDSFEPMTKEAAGKTTVIQSGSVNTMAKAFDKVGELKELSENLSKVKAAGKGAQLQTAIGDFRPTNNIRQAPNKGGGHTL
ncbi:hypothetical protein [Rickettsiales endosymbiont of Stachyamoeba lipophora]|uniref:hypothetical protein n=1 Tax=Rickettsiales endosymbiont of Stachyamoeba lipophora TaxID=2486578 RepID=UPI000F650DE4|nr:hypothetical protein [Rickettsiales endosymbiont of Stachyamoeba lipophora]AZL15544.1 hypothetical protein EF513_03125 [Rickettsiales endosymbiont of Stachyamoeba lipophora]